MKNNIVNSSNSPSSRKTYISYIQKEKSSKKKKKTNSLFNSPKRKLSENKNKNDEIMEFIEYSVKKEIAD